MEQPEIMVTGTVATKIPLPVVPLYDLKLAAQLIPCQHGSLRDFLRRHKADYPAVYRREGHGRRIRLLSATEISRVRGTMLKGPGLKNVLAVYPEL